MPEQFLHGVETVEVDDGIRPIQTVKSSVIGLVGTAPDAAEADWPLDEPVLCFGPRQAATLGASGTLKDALDAIYDQAGALVVVVRVAEGADADATMSKVVGNSVDGTGVNALLAAESICHVTPRILCAPGFTSIRPEDAENPETYLANPVVAELQGIADKLRSVVVADGPNTNNIDAVAYRTDWDSSRIYVVDPGCKVWDTATDTAMHQPASARVAGLISKMDNSKGFWWSPSNQAITGIVGSGRPIHFGLSDVNSEANYLNENDVATIIHQDGYRLWGNRTCSSDPLWAFLSVRRTADMIYESIEAAMLWAMDRPISAQLVLDIQDSVNAYLRHLKAMGAILGGRAWLDEELNTPDQLKAGKLFIDFDIEPPAPLEHLTFRAHREDGYYDELVADVLKAAAM